MSEITSTNEIWNECEMTLAEFHTAHWAVGTIYETAKQRYQVVDRDRRRIEDVLVCTLIGDVNDSGGCCECCSIRAEDDTDTIVLRWRRLI